MGCLLNERNSIGIYLTFKTYVCKLAEKCCYSKTCRKLPRICLPGIIIEVSTLFRIIKQNYLCGASTAQNRKTESLLCGSGYLHDFRMASHKQSSVVSSKKIFAFLNIFLKMYLPPLYSCSRYQHNYYRMLYFSFVCLFKHSLILRIFTI